MWGGYCPGSSRPHTPPTSGAKAVELSPAFLRANVCELSHTFLRAMRASPHCPRKEKTDSFPLSWESLTLSWLCQWVERQSECSKPEKFDELTSAWLSDTIEVFLAEMRNAATTGSKSKLEETSLLWIASLLDFWGSELKQNFYQYKILTAFLKYRIF